MTKPIDPWCANHGCYKDAHDLVGVPVAWRFRDRDEDAWRYLDDEPQAAWAVTQPLYAGPVKRR
jgi:hypothetical protein